MQDRFKCRMYDKNTKKMYSFENGCLLETTFECLKQQLAFDSKLNIFNAIAYDHIADGRIFMQCTGLKDNTRWDELSQKEKQDFYNQVCSEDGKTIKYRSVEDVEHLWSGKLIYEGDICEYEFDDIGKQKAIIYFNKKYASFMVKPINNFQYAKINDCEVIGNIYENGELLNGNNT